MYGINRRDPATMERSWITSEQIIRQLVPLAYYGNDDAGDTIKKIRRLEAFGIRYSNQDFDVLSHALRLIETATTPTGG